MVRITRWKAAAAATAAVLVLAACGGGSGDEAGGKPDKLVVWTYYTTPGQIKVMKQQNKLWNDEHPDIKIEHVQIPLDQLPSKLLATATTHDGPDVVLDNVVVDFPTLAAAGVLTDMTSYWKSYQDRELFPDSAVWSYKDKIYNVMSYTNLLGLFYNKDILGEYDMEPPTTMNDLQADMEKIGKDDKYVSLAESGAPTVEGAWMFMPLLLGQGVDYCNFEGDTVRQAFERVEGWSNDKMVPRATATWDQTDAWQEFLSGKYAFGINGNWVLGDARKASFDVGTARFPAGSQGSHVFPGGEGIGIGAFSKHKDLAWEYIQAAWLSKDASMTNFKGSGQIPTRSDLADNPAVADDELVAPFVAAAKETSPWPLNKETAAMQTAVGKSASAVISRQKTGAEGAQDAIDGVRSAMEKGGGSC